jgi:hypothetical protein
MPFRFDAIGTRWEIETDEPLTDSLCGEVLNRIRLFDATYSRFRSDSLVARIATAREGGRFEFSDDAIALFGLYDQLFAATRGAVEPLVGRQLEALGYDADYSLRPAPEERPSVAWATGVIPGRRDGHDATPTGDRRRSRRGRDISSTSCRRCCDKPGSPGSSSTPAGTCVIRAITASASAWSIRSTRDP